MKEQSEEHHKAYIRQLICEDNIIEAIKYIRKLTGTGLKESKELCITFMNDLTKLDDYSFFEKTDEPENKTVEFDRYKSDEEVIDKLKIMISKGEKLLAVKFAKEVLNIGLKEAKGLVARLDANESDSELIITGENEDNIIEDEIVFGSIDEIDESEAEHTEVASEISVPEYEIKKRKTKAKKRPSKKRKIITFAKIEERDRKKKNRNRSHSGCMVTLMIMLIIVLSITGTYLLIS